MTNPEAVETCDFDGCGRPAERLVDGERRLCAGHRKQLQRRGHLSPITPRQKSPRERLFDAMLALADADSEDDEAYAKAEERFWAASDAYSASTLARKGGLARARSLTPDQRRDIARKAALAAAKMRAGQ